MTARPATTNVRPGIRVLRGSTFSIPAGGLVASIGDDGAFSAEVREVHLASGTWFDWLHIAIERFEDAKVARKALTAGANDDAAESEALEREFRSSLQVVSAAVFALDGFYGVIQEHVIVAAAELAARRANRTSRPKWVADAIARAGRIPGNARSILRKNIITSYKIRDLAVHPEHAPLPPAVHHGLNQLVPSYVATFTIESSAGVMNTCIEAIMWVLDRPRAVSGPLFELSQSTSPLLHELVDPRLTYTPGSLLGPKPKIAE